MFDIENFVKEVCDRAYPLYGNADGETLSEFERLRKIEILKRELESLPKEKTELESEISTPEIVSRIEAIDSRIKVLPDELEALTIENVKIAYPQQNKWTFVVSDLLNIPDQVSPDLVVATWRLAGIDRNEIDSVQSGVNFEVMANASQIVALNAFHWSLMQSLRVHNGLRLSDLIGDVEDDEPVGKTMRWNARAFRVWGLTVSQNVTGMNVLFNEVEG